MATHVVRVPPKITAIKPAIVNPSTATTTTIVAAQAGASFRVVAYAFMTTAANNITFNTNSTPISPLWPAGANGGMVFPFNEHGWFQTAVGDPLTVTTSAATAAGIQVWYQVMTSVADPGA